MPRKKKSSGSSENHRLSSLSCKGEKPVQRNAANARERARMRVLSRAFCRLKTTLPWVPADTKLSKLDTLRLAASYIAHLKGILREDPFSSEDSVHPAMNLTWPFGFNRGGGNGSGGGGSGSEDAESGSSCAWEEVTKDCVHLDQEDDPTLQLHPHHHHHHHLESSTHLHHGPHNLHHSHHHHHHPSDDPADPLSYSRTNPQQQPSSSPSAANMIPGSFYRDDVMSIG